MGYGDTSPFIFAWMALLSLLNFIYLRRTVQTLDLIWIITTILIGLIFYGSNDAATRVVAYGVMIPFCFIVFKRPDLHALHNTAKLVRFIYILVALVQVIIGLESYSGIATTFMNIRYADGRGFTSVGPEPTAFAILYLLFAVTAYYIAKEVRPENSIKNLTMDLILIFAITLSSSYVMYILLFLLISTISQGKFLKLTFLTLIISFLFSGFVFAFPETRLSAIIINILSVDIADALSLLSIFDESVLDRLSQPVIAIWYSITNHMLPSQPSNVIDFAVNLGPAFEYLSSEKYDRAHLNTGIGELFVYFGLLALYPLYRIYLMFKYSANAGLIFTIIYIFSIPFGHPSYWSALAICYFALINSKRKDMLRSSSYSIRKIGVAELSSENPALGTRRAAY